MKRIFLSILVSISIISSGRAMNGNPEKYFDAKGYFLFETFKAALDASEEKEEFVNEFLGCVKTGKYPLFINDSTYVILYQGKEDTVGVTGDMSNWKDIIPMEKFSGTDLHFLKAGAEADARFEYWIMFGKNSFPALDQFNPYKGLSGFGQVSELAMPQYKRHEYFDKYVSGEKGSTEGINVHTVESKSLGYEHTVHVYLPAGYDNKKSYPAVYFQDGIDYLEFAQVKNILDCLIKENKIVPLIAVFVTPPNRLKAGMPNRMTEYGMNDGYVKFFTDELVPFIDSNYSTIKNPGMRLVAGDSFGGLISAYIPFSRPDVFALGYSQSGYQSFQNDRLIKLYAAENKKPLKLYVDTGLYERSVGLSFLPKEETDFLLANRRLKKVLEDKGYNFVYREYPEGHTWGNWKRHMIDALIYFFPIEVK